MKILWSPLAIEKASEISIKTFKAPPTFMPLKLLMSRSSVTTFLSPTSWPIKAMFEIRKMSENKIVVNLFVIMV